MEARDNEAARHQLEEELDTEIYPGTEIMTDVGSHHFIKSSSHSHAVLVPQPSDSAHDPLNWSPLWKFSAMALSTATTFSQGLGPTALGPMFSELQKSFHRDLASVVQFTGVCILVLGFSNFFWVPVQNAFGRRPVLILSTLICMVSNIWRAVATSYGSEMGACVLNGFGAGPAETAQPQITADVMFLHERGAYQTLYFNFYFASLMIGPIFAGSMAQHVGWRSFFWLNVALLGFVLVLLIFFFPETKWDRRSSQPETRQGVKDAATEQKDTSQTSATNDAAAPGSPSKVFGTAHVEDESLKHETTADAADPWLRRGYPSKKQFKVWQTDGQSVGSVMISFLTPWKLLFPIIELAAFIVSWSASVFLTLNLTQSQAFAAPPYNLGSQQIGFFNFAIWIGTLIGLATNGPLSDWISMRATKKNGGIREPEMRLPAMIPYVIICIIGNFIVGFGYQYKWPWESIVVIGYACAGIQVVAIPAIASTYAIDSYKPVAGLLFVTITINKNVWGYGFSKFITPWILESGFVKPIMLNMCLTVLWCLCTVPFYYYGKTMRKWTAKSSVHKM